MLNSYLACWITRLCMYVVVSELVVVVVVVVVLVLVVVVVLVVVLVFSCL